MNKIRKRYLFLLVMLACMFFAGHGASAQTDTESIKENYSIVSQRNIFSKNRKADISRSPKKDSEKAEAVIRVRNIMYVLRGISLDQDNKWIFLEDDLDGGTYKLTIGQEFEGMTVKEIHFSNAVFTVGDKEVTIPIGGNLAGREVKVKETAQAETTIKTDSTEPVKTEESDSSPGSSDESNILKQMMERRKKELGR